MENIKIENLSFVYPKEVKNALNNINLTINPGEFITICGKSGCGKSTLLKHLKPILSPFGKRTGEIYFGNINIENISCQEQAKKIGFVFQNPDNQIVTDKVWHELAFGLESLSYPTSEIRTRVAEIASFFGIGSWFHKNINELSGGEKQILNLASVMAMQPDILLLDEPTSQLDPISAQDFFDLTKKINREFGTTVILTEHRLESVFPISDRIIVMENGEIIADDTPQKIGEILNSKNSEMFFALPTPMRVYYSVKNEKKCPVTVREGRNWLREMPISNIKISDNEEIKGEKILELKDVWFRYEKNSPDILKGLSLSLTQGEIYAVVGGNGAGKTTTLSVISGLNKAYRGKIKTDKNKKIAFLSQNPQSLFIKNTIKLDLMEVVTDREKLKEVVDFCELNEFLDRHPYDLSGGEQQRAALAKVLLTNPQILLLDEPTKGLDAHFKDKLGNMLKELKNNGVTILMVSHDVEFCAKFADRCGLFFDGVITSEDKPVKFFSGKRFYTTMANRMSRGILENAITDEDIIRALGGENKKPLKKTIIPTVKKTDEKEIIAPKREKRKIPKKIIIEVIMILFLIPLTIFAGMKFFGNKKYYLISLLIILETMVPFALVFEGRKPQAREIVTISVLCALAVAGRTVFAMLPQFKPVVALVIISGICFGGETGFLVGAVTGFVSNFFFGQTPFTPWQMFSFGIIGFMAGLFMKNSFNKIKICIFGFLSTFIIYGGIMNFSSIVLSNAEINLQNLITVYSLGLYPDLVHSIATATFLFLISDTMIEKLERIKLKYKIYQK